MTPQINQSPVVVNTDSLYTDSKSFKNSCIGKIVIAIFHILTLGCFMKGSSLRDKNVSKATILRNDRPHPVFVSHVATPVAVQGQQSGLGHFVHVNNQAVPYQLVLRNLYQGGNNGMAYVNRNATQISHVAPKGSVSHNPRPTEVNSTLHRQGFHVQPTAPTQTNPPRHNPRPTSVPFGMTRG